MHIRGAVHHYRVAGVDGVLYLAPVAWFLAGHVKWFANAAFVSKSDLGERAYINALFAKMVSLHTPEPAA